MTGQDVDHACDDLSGECGGVPEDYFGTHALRLTEPGNKR